MNELFDYYEIRIVVIRRVSSPSPSPSRITATSADRLFTATFSTLYRRIKRIDRCFIYCTIILTDLFQAIVGMLLSLFRTIELNLNIYIGLSFSKCLYYYTTPKAFCLNGTERICIF